MTIACHIGATNTHDIQMLKKTAQKIQPLQKIIKCRDMSDVNLLVIVPRKTRKRGGGITHYLRPNNINLLEKKEIKSNFLMVKFEGSEI